MNAISTPAQASVPVSVVILAKDEEHNIVDCLRSVGWAAERIVMDDESRDRTKELALGLTPHVFTRRMTNEGADRNHAYGRASHSWILSLDADERVTPALASEIAGLVRGQTDHVAFAIPLRNFLGSIWIRHGGWYPAPKVRLFRKGKFRYEEVNVHPRVQYDGTCGRLQGEIEHYSYRDIHEFFHKLNNQTTREAQKWIQQGLHVSLAKALRKTVDRFMRALVLKRGYRDGVVGWVIASGAGLYQFMSYVKYWEMKRAVKGERNTSA